MHENSPDTRIARHLMIHGVVQGVYYRATAKAEAERLGLHGWVRNRSNGCVEALVSGPDHAVQEFIAWAQRGPTRARVERIDSQASEHPPHSGFLKLPTL